MIGQRLRIEGARFLKSYPDAETADRALAYSLAARAAGVPTPAAHPLRGRESLAFDLVDGTGGSSLVAHQSLDRLMAPLRRLNAMPGTGLAPLDPFRRIDPRLAAAPAAVRRRVEALRPHPAPAEPTVVHGDFHPGQVILDPAGKVWLLDLDDLARAPAEADLGNLAAWLATRPAADGPDLMEGLAQAFARVADGWARLGGRPRPALIAHFAEIALIRRALKLAERGQRDVLDRLTAVLSPT